MEPYAAAKVIAIRDCMLTWHTGCSSRDMLVHNAEKGAIRQTFILPVDSGHLGAWPADCQCPGGSLNLSLHSGMALAEGCCERCPHHGRTLDKCPSQTYVHLPEGQLQAGMPGAGVHGPRGGGGGGWWSSHIGSDTLPGAEFSLSAHPMQDKIVIVAAWNILNIRSNVLGKGEIKGRVLDRCNLARWDGHFILGSIVVPVQAHKA